jgi:Ca-activated chloride channel homolog
MHPFSAPARPPIRHRAPCLAWLIPLAMVVLAQPAASQGWILPEPGIDRDRPATTTLGVPPFQAVERLRTHVRVRIEGRIAHVEVEEWFRNRSGGIAEGVYLYPLPGESVFQGYSLFQGDAEFTGEMLDAGEARSTYEAIVRTLKDPALIELVDGGLVQASVFPFAPGETRRILLRYTHRLERTGDAVVFRHVGAGPGPGPGALLRTDDAPVSFTIEVAGAGDFLDPFSPTHPVRSSREDGTLRIHPDGDLRGRFAVFLPLAGEPVRVSLATHRPASGDGYFMLTLSPDRVSESTIPRDLTAVVDVSGSMSGEKIDQTRRALLQLLGSLGPGDRFRLIRFASSVEAWRPGWTRATGPDLAEAREWVSRLSAQGGTNIAGALDEALRVPSDAGRLPVVVFLTDGLPTVGERDPDAIARAVAAYTAGERVFAFGVGYDVDANLLDHLAMAGRGSVQYVGPGEDVEVAVGTLAMKIRHPVLTDLELDAFPVRIRDLAPTRLPDLFAGEELTLFGRYEGAGSGPVRLTGEREGRRAGYEVLGAFPEHASGNDFIPRLWAARRIGELSREARLGGAEPELVEEIRRLALRYGILTEFTSYLVLEPDVVVDGRRAPPVPEAMPASLQLRSGEAAARSSAAAGAAMRARSAGDLALMESVVVAGAERAGRSGAPEGLRVVAGRAFVERDGVWTDRSFDPEGTVVEIEAFSPAYFALLDALPELRSWWSSLHPVIVAGNRVSLRVVETGGASRMTAREAGQIAERFRSAPGGRGR